jgi:hypothetical protein
MKIHLQISSSTRQWCQNTMADNALGVVKLVMAKA